MKLAAARVWVRDLEVAREFYGSVLGLKPRWAYPFAVGYDVGETLIIEVDDGSEPGERLVGRFAGLSLHVDDIHQTYQTLSAKGVVFESPPEVMYWGGTLANFRDPDGNVITLWGD